MDPLAGQYETIGLAHVEGRRRRIGIMGGSFNPIHCGHLEMAEHAYKALGLDTVLFIPLGDPPHKQDLALADAVHRRNMVELAIEGQAHFVLNEMELVRDGYTYAADTLLELRSIYTEETELCYLLGADAFLYIRQWYAFPRVLELATYVVFQRYDEDAALVKQEAEALEREYGANIILLSHQPVSVSSTFIRESLREGRDMCGLLPKKVEAYLERWRLYRD